ncbi:restriction endonuclease subunit S [Acinetobacter bohemicus]|uniref:restriction endonuclease subunit S n=2 Tax=Acinetobacter TaxID=469 RepID=UPI00192BEE2B|nr:restriction endonuclease subunit S [Acinetobacter bohemicus]CAD9196497.1 hypothetical protein QAC21B_02644 [Acinetobacter bohemicus]
MMFEKYDAYKDSYIQGIKLIPEKWKVIKLKYLLDSKAGFAFPSDAFSDSGTAVVRISDLLVSGVVDISKSPKLPSKFNKYLSEYFAEEGNILMAMTGGTIGKVSIYKYEQKSFLNQRVCKFIPKANFYPKLAWYWMNTDVWKDYIDLKAFGGAQPNISDNTIKEMQICLPDSLDTQISICNFLDKKTYEIEQVIAIKEQQIALLNERKQIVIQKAVTQGLDSNVPMKDSGVEWIGQIPEHWEIRANRTIFKERNEQGKEGLPLLSVSIHSGVSNEEISEEDNVRGRVKIEDKSKYILVKKGDIAFNMMRAWQGGIGAVSVDGMVSPAYIVAKPNDLINSEFFEYQYRCPEFIQQMDRYSKGITDFRKRLYWDGFKQLVTVVPPLEEQLKIVEQIKAIEQQTNFAIQIKNQQIEKLKEYKTTLINDAVTGKIKVA